MKIKHYKFMNLNFAIAAPKTVWWNNNRYDGLGRIREDHLVGFTRSYFRDRKQYIYAIRFGRFKMYWLK